MLFNPRAAAGRSGRLLSQIVERIERTVWAHWSSSSDATGTHRRNYAIAADAFEPFLATLRQLVEIDLAQLESELEEIGAPWTPGRRGVPAWSRE